MLSLNMEGFLIKWSCNMHVICVWEWFPLSRKSHPVWQIGCCCRLVRKEESNVIVVTSSWRWHEERTARRSFPKFKRHWFQKRACCCWVSGCKPNPQAEQKFIFCVYYVDNTFRKVWNLFLIEEKMTVIIRVATAQGKQGIWFLLFPDRENTGNFALTQGKILRHRENIFLWHREKFRHRENIWLWLLK